MVTMTYNFFNFDPENPEITNFDISSCFSDSKKISFKMQYLGKYLILNSKLDYIKKNNPDDQCIKICLTAMRVNLYLNSSRDLGCKCAFVQADIFVPNHF